MPPETAPSQPADTKPAPLTREQKIKAYYDAPTREAKAAVVEKYPELAAIFSAGNHS
jgi:hypothetical protein